MEEQILTNLTLNLAKKTVMIKKSEEIEIFPHFFWDFNIFFIYLQKITILTWEKYY